MFRRALVTVHSRLLGGQRVCLWTTMLLKPVEGVHPLGFGGYGASVRGSGNSVVTGVVRSQVSSRVAVSIPSQVSRGSLASGPVQFSGVGHVVPSRPDSGIPSVSQGFTSQGVVWFSSATPRQAVSRVAGIHSLPPVASSTPMSSQVAGSTQYGVGVNPEFGFFR